jgi:1-acyl-sn-glycerol-3-phosphate acyltransferase
VSAGAALRRAVMLPLVVAVELVLVAASPLLVAAAAVVSVGTHSSRPLRSVALVLAYALIELRLLPRLLRGGYDGDALLRDVLARAYATMRRVLDVRVEIEAGSAGRAQVAETSGLVVLARHCGPGDSLFIAWLLAVHYELRLRIVLKWLLRLEPSVDLAGDRLPLCFVAHRRRKALAQISQCAAAMTRPDALLLFPEGGNFSRPRWRRAVADLARSATPERARRALRMTHTLPPRLGGALAALNGAPDAAVLLVEHTGFAPDGRERPWWRLPVHRTLVVRTVLVPAAEVPRTKPELTVWLDAAWSQVDSWVAAHAVEQA